MRLVSRVFSYLQQFIVVKHSSSLHQLKQTLYGLYEEKEKQTAVPRLAETHCHEELETFCTTWDGMEQLRLRKQRATKKVRFDSVLFRARTIEEPFANTSEKVDIHNSRTVYDLQCVGCREEHRAHSLMKWQKSRNIRK